MLVETLSVSFGLHVTGAGAVLSIVYTISGLAIAALYLRTPSDIQERHRFSITAVIISLVLLAAFVWFGYQRMLEEPLSYEAADMLPIIKVMNERMLSGDFSKVYEPIPAIWNGATPIYLPAMWMPFAIPVALHADLRWLTVGCLFVVYLLLLYQLRFSKRDWFLLMIGILLAAWIFIDEIPGLLPFSEEGIVVLYYSLLVIALQGRKAWAIGIVIGLCLLSRYTLIGWLPAYLVWLLWTKRFKQLWISAATATVTIVMLVLPFRFSALLQLFKLPGTYIDFARRVWHDSPEVFTEGPGLARFFGPAHIPVQHSLLVACSLSIPVIATMLCLKFREKWKIDPERLPLAMLKLTLVVFFSLVDVPYQYLFYTSSFVSLLMLAPLMRDRKIRQ